MSQDTTGKNSLANLMQNWGNMLFVFFLKAIALLPFSVLYFLSDILFLVLKNVIKYRSDVILDNLHHAFPEKPEFEIFDLRNKFYRYFCDMSLESVKLHYMSNAQMQKRVQFEGTELLNEYAEKGRGAILLAFHHNNWEWGSALQPLVKHKVLMVYNKMRDNTAMDNFLLHSREKWGGKAVQMGRSAKVTFDYARKGEPALVWLIADQSALATSQAWAMYFNREAAFFTGPEKIAGKTNYPVFFQHVKRIGRGKYKYEFSLICDEPASAKPNEILLSYIEKMEEVIRKEPEYYLWSHKRWKHQRPENIPLIKRQENG